MKKKKIIIFIITLITIPLILGSIFLLEYPQIKLEKQKEIQLEEEKPNIKKDNIQEDDEDIIIKEIRNNPNNYILIDGILQKRLMDDDGSYYYLNHNLEGVYDQIGIPIVDVRTTFETRKSLIYAHSTKAGNGPFQVLQNYHNNKDFFEQHRYITINYNDILHYYEIFSVYISTADSEESEGLEYFYRMKYTDKEWKDTIQKYKSLSEYDTGTEVNENDKILILQTCSMDPNYYEKYYRYNLLIFAKEIEKN